LFIKNFYLKFNKNISPHKKNKILKTSTALLLLPLVVGDAAAFAVKTLIIVLLQREN